MSLSDVGSGRLTFNCGFPPSKCGFKSGSVRFKVRAGAVRGAGYTNRKLRPLDQTAGTVMHPDSVTGYCDRFSEKYGLKHINPHAFRHTMASLLYFAGLDSVSIAGHLGHAKPSTTANMYAHVMAEAESRIADCMGQIVLTTRKPLTEESNSDQTAAG